MPYAPHTLIRIGGSLLENTSQPTEIWQIGIRCTGVTDLAAFLAALGGDDDTNPGTIHQWWGTALNLMSTQATLNFVSVAAVSATSQAPALVHNYPSPIPGPQAATVPNFVSLCITLETANPKGPGGRGRVYPPNAPGYVGGSVDAGGVKYVADSGVSLIDACTGGGTLSAVPVVASKTYGTLHPIVACSADAILDTQRRRRNQLTPFRQTSTV